MKFNPQLSFRRNLLNQALGTLVFTGDVLDVGGKKSGKKSGFVPPTDVTSWRYVNIDAATTPDFLASADALPLPDACADTVLMSEVLEHLQKPEQALREAARVSRPGAKFYISVPFIYAVHGDPYDYQRWTPEKLRLELASAGFKSIEIAPMGGIYAAIADLLESYAQLFYQNASKPPFGVRLLRFLLRNLFFTTLINCDKKTKYRDLISGGFFVKAIRNG